MDHLNNRHLLVLGLGESGLAMVRWCASHGAHVRVWDSREAPPQAATLHAEWPQVPLASGALDPSTALQGVELVLKSPGLSPLDERIRPLLEEARAAGIPVQGELDLFARALAELKHRRGYAPQVLAITGTNGKTTTSRMLAHIQKMNGHTVGLATTDGVYIDGVRTVAGDMTGPQSAQMVLRDPAVDLAVLETARGGLLRAGMGYRTCNVGAVLNVTSDHLGIKGIDTLEQLAEVKRIVVEVARDCAVVNADDLHCLKMADHTKATRIAYVTMNPKHDLVRKHLRAGGLAAVLEEGINGHMITLYDKGVHLPLLWTHLVPATLEGKAMHNVQNAMFAAVMAYAMGVKVENIRQGLRTFDTSYFQVPGRTNVFDKLPFKVILDYGHNPAAVQAMADLALRLDCTGKRICVLAAPGDRRDEDIRAIARIAGKTFDRLILRRDDDLRGRGPDEVPRLLEAELLATGFPAERLSVVPDEQEAVDVGLRAAQPGDLLLVFADKISRSWKQVIYFKPDGEAEARSESHAPPPPPSSHALPLGLDVAGAAGEGLSGGMTVIADERGVRIAREQDD